MTPLIVFSTVLGFGIFLIGKSKGWWKSKSTNTTKTKAEHDHGTTPERNDHNNNHGHEHDDHDKEKKGRSFSWVWNLVFGLLGLGVVILVLFWGYKKVSKMFEEKTHDIVLQEGPRQGSIILQPGEETTVWLSCYSSHTRVTGGCVEISRSGFRSNDCPGKKTKGWDKVSPGNYIIKNWGSAPVKYKWWVD